MGDHTVKLWTRVSSCRTHWPRRRHSKLREPDRRVPLTTSRDCKLRSIPARVEKPCVSPEGHGGIKGARFIWIGDRDRIASTGFSRMSGRQVGAWETGSIKNLKTITLDQSVGAVIPFWSDNNILSLGEPP